MIYFDQAATSFPKSQRMMERTMELLQQYGVNAGRGSYHAAKECERIINECRERVLQFFDAPQDTVCVFTSSCTDSLSLFFHGTTYESVITDSMSHNAIARNLHARYRPKQILSLDEKPKGNVLYALTHTSNVTGETLPLSDLSFSGDVLVDCSQSAGHRPVSMQKENIQILTCSGHKGLGAFQGIGVLLFPKDLPILPYRYGGTGTHSESEEMPAQYPERLEAGTPNIPGIFSLNESLKEIERIGLSAIVEVEGELSHYLYRKFTNLPVRIYSTESTILSFTPQVTDLSVVSDLLDSAYGIACRTGLHCAPAAHRKIGTFPYGTIRLSINHTNTKAEIDQVISALQEILRFTN